MKIVGHCRFSWFGISDTGRSIADLETAHEILWHPERMAIRFQLFENIMLPSISSQTDSNFVLKVLISNELPKVYRDRLEKCVAPMPNVHLLSTSERDIGRALRPTINASLEDGAKAVHFRLDDDDALSSQFISKLRQICQSDFLSPGTAVSFPTGFSCFLHKGRAKHTEHHHSYIAAGLAFVVGETYRRHPFQVQHRKVGRRQPSFVDPTFHAFQVTLHAVNNTKGYNSVIHDANIIIPRIQRHLHNNPELENNVVATPLVDQMICDAFTDTSGPELRAHLERTRDPKVLAEEFSFL